jgi:hypothetical protein
MTADAGGAATASQAAINTTRLIEFLLGRHGIGSLAAQFIEATIPPGGTSRRFASPR